MFLGVETDNVLIAPFNDIKTTKKIVEENEEDLAGVIVEPLHRCTPPKVGIKIFKTFDSLKKKKKKI